MCKHETNSCLLVLALFVLRIYLYALNSQFKLINSKFNVSVYSHKVFLAYTCYYAGFDTELLKIPPSNFT